MSMKPAAKPQDESQTFAYDLVNNGMIINPWFIWFIENEASKLVSLEIKPEREELKESKAKATLRGIADGKI